MEKITEAMIDASKEAYNKKLWHPLSDRLHAALEAALAARPAPEAVIDQYIAAGRKRRNADDLRLNSAAVWMADDQWEDAKLGLRMLMEERAEKIEHLKRALSDIAKSDDVENALDPERNKRVARAALQQAHP